MGHQDTGILYKVKVSDKPLVICQLEGIDRHILLDKEIIPDDPVPRFSMQLVQYLGAEILQPVGRIGKGLLKAISPDKDMADDLAFVRLERALTLGVQRRNLGKGVGPALGDGIAKELKDIIVSQTFISMDCTVFQLPI
jgi:hypothetical protein